MARAFIVVDLTYGDAGKGATVDYLVRHSNADTVIRFNGGPQAAHNVVLPDGRHHTFSQWGAGTFAGARTFLSKHVLVNPLNAFAEAQHLEENGVRDPFSMLAVHPAATIITPWHVAENRIREAARGDGRHGSCGEGIGATVQDQLNGYAIHMDDLRKPDLKYRLMDLVERKATQLHDELDALCSHHWTVAGGIENVCEGFAEFASKVKMIDRVPLVGDVVLEGAQGVMIDETHGYAPYHTWSDCTFGNALSVLAGFSGEIVRLGVCRTYMTRHGPGPFVTETDQITIPEVHNGLNDWQGSFRLGWMNFEELRYAIKVCGGIDGLVVTHADHGMPGYEKGAVAVFGRKVDVPIVLRSYGPTHRDRVAD